MKGGAGEGGVSREMPGNSLAREIIDITLIQNDKNSYLKKEIILKVQQIGWSSHSQ